MKVLLGCDVDPVLPPLLDAPPPGDIWQCLDAVDALVSGAGGELPPITWLIRADESIRFSTGDFASGYLTRAALWDTLRARDHELGWHMHAWSFDKASASFRFDPDPSWLAAAHGALSRHFDVRSTRTGWDYGSTRLLQQLDRLGVWVDFSALPGHIAWFTVGRDRITVDWLRCPAHPYHPARDDHQRPGELRLLEVPITPFASSAPGMMARVAWRMAHGSLSLRGARSKTRLLTDRWDSLPPTITPVWAFYFHPEDLEGEGARRLMQNVARLRRVPGVEFVTASELA